jgi:hypothetical protein
MNAKLTFPNRNSGWDLSVHDQNDQLILVVEVKAILNTSPEWAAKLRRNIFAHGTFPEAPFFLIVCPDKLYLWTNALIQKDQVLPNYVIDASQIFQPYFDRVEVTPTNIGQNLELIVSSWLGEIIYGENAVTIMDESQRWLIDSGLYEALHGGEINKAIA